MAARAGQVVATGNKVAASTSATHSTGMVKPSSSHGKRTQPTAAKTISKVVKPASAGTRPPPGGGIK